MKIDEIKIEIRPGHKIKLSLSEAQQLKKILNETFPDPWNPTIISPIIIEKTVERYQPYSPFPFYEVACNDNVMTWSLTG